MIFKVTHRKNNIIKEITQWILTFGIAIIISLFIGSNILTLTQIKEQSMAPTFNENDRIIVYKLGYYFKSPKKGDIIILSKNNLDKGLIINMKNEAKDIIAGIKYRFTGNIEKNNLIKRVVATAGDIIDIKDGNLYINEEMEKGYEFFGKTYENSSFSYPLIVPKDKVFVLGDNRERSLDSRELGLISNNQVKGRAIFRIWPISNFGGLR